MAKYKVIAQRGLNVRTGPGIEYPRLSPLPFGAEVKSVTIPDGWMPVLYRGGVAWVASEYLEEVPDQDEVSGILDVNIYQYQLYSLFGEPRDPAPYLKILDFQEFRSKFDHVLDYLGNPWSLRIYGHELLEAPLRRAMRLLVELDLSWEWHTYDGCFNIRRMKGSQAWSTHSWGLAIDINALENPYGSKPVLSQEFVACFTEAGFIWGGTWRTPDGMHFQIPKL